jgi:oligopeptide transport system substrate-binding protein
VHFDRHGVPQPAIAQSWDISPDAKTYTFHLRSNARWSNNAPVTANDFVESWKRTLLPETAAEYAYVMYHIKNAGAFNEGKIKDFSLVGVHALDAHTFPICPFTFHRWNSAGTTGSSRRIWSIMGHS